MEHTINDYWQDAFNRYISLGFANQHCLDFKTVSRHFAYNYLQFLQQDKNAPILDIGCGMGDFLYFLREHG